MWYNIFVKKCTACKQRKNISDFNSDKSRGDGLSYRCKNCSNKLGIIYRQVHKIEIRAYHQSLNRKIKEKIINILGGKCSNCGIGDLRVLQVDHIDGGGNRERNAFGSRYLYRKLLAIRDITGYQLLCANCNWIKRHIEKEDRNGQGESYIAKYHRKQRRLALQKLGNKCTKCGNNDERVLQIDHISGGGNEERNRVGTGMIYRKIARGQILGSQLLCANCNWIKIFEDRELIK